MKIACGYLWGHKEDASQLSILDLEHSFNAAVLDDGTGKMFDQHGRGFIQTWKEGSKNLSFVKCYAGSPARTFYVLTKHNNAWSGTWENKYGEHGFIVMWVTETEADLFAQTAKFIQDSEHLTR